MGRCGFGVEDDEFVFVSSLTLSECRDGQVNTVDMIFHFLTCLNQMQKHYVKSW